MYIYIRLLPGSCIGSIFMLLLDLPLLLQVSKMGLLNLVQAKFPVKEEVLINSSQCLSFMPRVGVVRSPLHTKIVRGKNISKNRMIPVALPVQNHGTGDAFKLCDTTLDAYSDRLVAAARIVSGVPMFSKMQDCDQLLLLTVL